MGLSAYSEKPSPKQSILSQAQQNKAELKQTKSDSYQRGTDEYPLAVKIIQAQKHESEARSTNDSAVVNWLLVFFNGILAVSTLLLWISTYKLWQTTAQSIEITKKEFFVSHPPKLRVHSIAWHWYVEAGKPWKIQCAITNIGGSTATIKRSNLSFSKFENELLPTILPFSSEEHMLSENPIAPGEYIVGELTLDERIATALNIKMWNTPRRDNEENPFYFFGYIDYLDDGGITRRTAFCRQLNIETYRFTAIQGDDYEYSY